MPLVLTESEITVSGHEYADRAGVSYEYPTRYRNLIQTGEQFVYYYGRRLASGRTRQQAYFGSGVIGTVAKSSGDRLKCEILDYSPFEEPVPFKRQNGQYWESTANENLGHWRSGVRRISIEEYRDILAAAKVAPQVRLPPFPGYASSEAAQAVEDYSVKAALAYLEQSNLYVHIEEMPHNNPGFDILARDASELTTYVEVKGTRGPDPCFFLSEGERAFSENNAASYTLVVVHAIDLKAGEHLIIEARGAVTRDQLVPTQWRGRLRRHA